VQQYGSLPEFRSLSHVEQNIMTGLAQSGALLLTWRWDKQPISSSEATLCTNIMMPVSASFSVNPEPNMCVNQDRNSEVCRTIGNQDEQIEGINQNPRFPSS
jgi:hypothetical protein